MDDYILWKRFSTFIFRRNQTLLSLIMVYTFLSVSVMCYVFFSCLVSAYDVVSHINLLKNWCLY